MKMRLDLERKGVTMKQLYAAIKQVSVRGRVPVSERSTDNSKVWYSAMKQITANIGLLHRG
jgi:hypothetical protein